MIGYFEAIDKETGKTVEKFKYSTVSDAAKVYLRNNLDKYKLQCCCNGNHVEMKISNDLKIYPAKNNTGTLHEKSCPKYPELNKNLWRIEKEESLYFNVANPDANAKDYAIKINSLTDQYITRKKLDIQTYQEFNKKVYYIINFVKMEDGTILKNIYSAQYRNCTELNTNTEVFVYGILKKISSTDFSKEILYIDIENIFGDVQRFYVNKNMFLEFYNKSYAKQYHLLVCGFAYKKSEKSKILTFSDFYMTTISSDGIIF